MHSSRNVEQAVGCVSRVSFFFFFNILCPLQEITCKRVECF